jgi:hypothetical protein
MTNDLLVLLPAISPALVGVIIALRTPRDKLRPPK